MPKVFLIKKNLSISTKKAVNFRRYVQYDSYPYAVQLSHADNEQSVYDFYESNIHNEILSRHDEILSRKNHMKLTYDDNKSDYSDTSPCSVESLSQFDFYSNSLVQALPCTCCIDQCITGTARNINFDDHNEPKKKQASHLDEKPFICSVCGKGFRLSSTLCRHKIIHTAQRPHKCHVCQKSFNRSSTLKTHLRTHNKLKEFVCNVCGKGFHQKGNLRNHILIHTGEKPHTCKICMKSFNKLSNLKFHMHSHTDHKPYRCRFCKLSMARRGELKQHIASYHPNEA